VEMEDTSNWSWFLHTLKAYWHYQYKSMDNHVWQTKGMLANSFICQYTCFLLMHVLILLLTPIYLCMVL
jgi:hypothetical protein